MSPVETPHVVIEKAATPPGKKEQATMPVCEDGEGSLIVGENVGPGVVCENIGPVMVVGENVGLGMVMEVGVNVGPGVVKHIEEPVGWHAHAAELQFDQQRSAQNQHQVFGSSCLS